MTESNGVVPGGYISITETIARLGQSIATIERAVKRGELRTEEVPRGNGKKAERFYLAEDVDKLKSEREAKQALRPPSAVAGAVAVRPAKAELVLASEAAGVAREIAEWFRPALWLTPKQAAQYSGLPRKILLAACREGRLTAIPRNGSFLIRRASLEAFEG
jgi:hypothetical protein